MPTFKRYLLSVAEKKIECNQEADDDNNYEAGMPDIDKNNCQVNILKMYIHFIIWASLHFGGT